MENGDNSYEKAVSINPKFVSAWNNIGYSYSNLGKYEKALEYYQKAIDIDSNYASAWFNLGITHNNLDEEDKALNAFEKALKLDPENKGAKEHIYNIKKKRRNAKK